MNQDPVELARSVEPLAPQTPELNKLGLFSKASEEARASKQQKMPPDQWTKYLLGRGVKPDEIKWSGFGDAFADQKSVHKDDVAAHFRENALSKYTETLKDDTLPHPRKMAVEMVNDPSLIDKHFTDPDKISNIKTGLDYVKEDAGPNTAPSRVKAMQAEWLEENYGSEFKSLFDSNRTQYQDKEYNIPSDDERDYRELVVQHDPENSEFKASGHWSEHGPLFHLRMRDFEDWPSEIGSYHVEHKDDRRDFNQFRSLGEVENFLSTKSPEERERYSVIPVRNRATKPHKTLHVEEIQSDWGQRGRQKGFSDVRQLEKEYDDLHEKWKDLVAKNQKEHEEKFPDLQGAGRPYRWIARDLGKEDEFEKLSKARESAYNRLQNPIPHGPHVEDTNQWTDLALKRILYEAAKNGQDSVMITGGDEQARRWNNEGLKKFYDQTVPNRLQKLLSQHDPNIKVRQEPHNFINRDAEDDEDVSRSVKMHKFDLTPRARESILSGQQLFRRGGTVERDAFGFGGETPFAGSRPERGSTGSASAARQAREAPAPREAPSFSNEGSRGGGGGGSDAMGFKNLDFSKGASESANQRMESAFPTKMSGFAGAPAIGMPQNLKELQEYNAIQPQDQSLVAPGLRTYSFFNPDFAPRADISSLTANKNPITGTGESAALTGAPQDRPFMTASQALQREAQKGFGAQPDTGALAEYSQGPSPSVAANVSAPPPAGSSSSAEYNVKFDPVQQSFVRTTEPQTLPNVAMGMSGRVSPPPATTPNVAMNMPGRISPESLATPNVAMGMSGRVSPPTMTPNVAMGMSGRISPESIAPSIPMGMSGRISPASAATQQTQVAAKAQPAPAATAPAEDALVLPGQKLFKKSSEPPMPPIPLRDLGEGSLLDMILTPFGLDTNSWINNKSSEYMKQGFSPSDSAIKASYDLRDLQQSMKSQEGKGGNRRRLVKKLMPDGTYQDVWEEYARGGFIHPHEIVGFGNKKTVSKKPNLHQNSPIVEHALAKVRSKAARS